MMQAIMALSWLWYRLAAFMPVYGVEYLCPSNFSQFLEAFRIGNFLALCQPGFKLG
jgi:hypothetical protein